MGLGCNMVKHGIGLHAALDYSMVKHGIGLHGWDWITIR